jgi:RND superfamily putative drug exporter
MFHRLGAWCARRRGTVVIIWLVVLVAGGALSGAIGSNFSTELSLPDVESKRGFDVLEAEMGGLGTGIEGNLVIESPDGFEDPAVREGIDAYLAEIEELPDVAVTSPFAAEETDPDSPLVQWLLSGTDDPASLLELSAGNERIATQGDAAGTIAYATIEVPGDRDLEAVQEVGQDIIEMAPEIDGVRFEYGGDLFQEFEAPESELLGLAFAIIILIAAFGSVLAMGLPIGVALAGIGVGSISLMLISNLYTMPDFATTLGIMIGLGVGIDYALFIVTRFREQMHAGHSVEESVAVAIDTSGRAVTFAGITVVISLLGMLLMGVSFVSGLGIGAATVVTITMIASLTLLPALLSYAGPRVEVTRWRGLISAGLVALGLVGAGLKISPLLVAFPLALVVLIAGFAVKPLKKELVRRPPKPIRETSAYRWSRFVQAHPWSLALGAVALLAVLTIPLFSLRLGFSDAGNLPEESSGRQAYDLLSDGFGPGSNGPLLLVTEVPEGTDLSTSAEFMAISQALLDVPGVQSVSPPVPSNFEDPASSTAMLWTVIPTTSPQDEATYDLVDHLRTDVLPTLTDGSGLDVLVTGSVAIGVDFSDYLAGRMVLFFGVVLGLSFLLLMAVFRSLLVPLKAVIMNLLSIGAAYGAVVAIFQWGWFSDIFGVEPAPIEPFIPMMLFAIVFGLSMDYEVFLLSRIREEWSRTGDSGTSVADGVAATARVITAAAAIMVFVFGSFLLEDDRAIKLFGFGLAFAVLLDATVIRMLLVPATMELLGDKNWWIPRWLDRILPNLNVEGPAEAVEEELEEEGVLV